MKEYLLGPDGVLEKKHFEPNKLIIMSYDTSVSEWRDEKDWIKNVSFLSGELIELDDIKFDENFIYNDSLIVDMLYKRYRTKVFDKKFIKNIGYGVYELFTRNVYTYDKQHSYYKSEKNYIEDESYFPIMKLCVIVRIKDGKLIFIE
jgi:hypothetical protein